MGWKMNTVIKRREIFLKRVGLLFQSTGHYLLPVKRPVSKCAFVSVAAGHVQLPQPPKAVTLSVASNLHYPYTGHKSCTVTLNIY